MFVFFERLSYRLVGLLRRPVPPPSSSVGEDAFRDAMSRAVQGVAIVTTDGPAGRFGITVSSVVSASTEPPLVLACIHGRSPAGAAIVRNRSFCINLLGARHRELADVFAGRPAEGAPYDFGSTSWAEGVRGLPVLEDAVASLECILHGTGRAGTHRVLVGRCVGVRTSDGAPLIYTGRRYGAPATWPPAAAQASAGEVGAATLLGDALVDPVAATEGRSLSTGRRIA